MSCCSLSACRSRCRGQRSHRAATTRRPSCGRSIRSTRPLRRAPRIRKRRSARFRRPALRAKQTTGEGFPRRRWPQSRSGCSLSWQARPRCARAARGGALPRRRSPSRSQRPRDRGGARRCAGPAPVAAAPSAAGAPATNGSSRPPALGYTTVAAPGEAERERLREEAKLIQAACQEHGLALGKLVRDLESQAGSELSRPGLSYALARLDAKEYGCLVVTRLDRLTRSAANLGTLLRMLREREARLIVIDIGLDTGTADGRIAAEALVTVGGLDQRKIEERTRNGLEAARSGRRASGRPAVADRPSLKQRIVDMRASGMTLQAIADTLNREGVPTVRGGAEWRPSSVQAAAGYKRPNRSRAGK